MVNEVNGTFNFWFRAVVAHFTLITTGNSDDDRNSERSGALVRKKKVKTK